MIFSSTDQVFISNAPLSTESFNLDSFKVYPNPAKDILNIKITGNDLPDSISVYNMLGQMITTKTVHLETDLRQNISTLENGMYFIKITKDNQSTSVPFIKE